MNCARQTRTRTSQGFTRAVILSNLAACLGGAGAVPTVSCTPDEAPCAPSLTTSCQSDEQLMELIHTCYRITDPERSVAFYEALGLENGASCRSASEAMNYFLGVPGKPMPELELTYNFGVDAYELGTAYGHIALTVEDMTETLEKLAAQGIEPERAPYSDPRGRLAALLRPRPGRYTGSS